jgi:hypothetical protein
MVFLKTASRFELAEKSYHACRRRSCAGTAAGASAIDLFRCTGMESGNLVGKPGLPVTLLP